MYPFLDFGVIKIPLYSLLFIVGFFLAMSVVYRRRGEFCLDSQDAVFGGIYGAIGMLLGAKLFYFLTKLPKIIMAFDVYSELFVDYPLKALDYAFGGMVFYGGLIGFFWGVWRYCRRYHVPFICFSEGFTPMIPFVHGIGRIGCFFSGCCYGIEYHGPLSVQFPAEAVAQGASLVPRFPVQLLEAGINFIIAAVLFILQKKHGCDVRGLCNILHMGNVGNGAVAEEKAAGIVADNRKETGRKEKPADAAEGPEEAEMEQVNSGSADGRMGLGQGSFGKRLQIPGTLLGIYLFIYAIVRFFLEFLRDDPERGIVVGKMSTSQFISLLLIPAAIWLLRGGLMKGKKNKPW